MNFDAPVFLTVFLPLLAGIHCLLRRDRARSWLLLIAGLCFYSFGSFSGLGVLLVTAAVNYVFGLALQKKRSRGMLGIGIALDLLLLGAYKYLAFFAGSLFGAKTMAAAASSWLVPLGLSFFTFKCISYLIDTYRDAEHGTRSFFALLLYVSFFPQIVAGPISRFPDFSAQLSERSVSAERMALGFRRFLIGLAKKIFLAGAMSRIVDPIYALNSADLSAALAWIAAAAYTLQIFFDFSAYSDMAIGLGEMFGFSAPENFDDPYIASSVGDFWRRWHISLSLWFRDYLYIPLGGNRKGKWRAALNKLIVFTLCGFWHGAAWTFLLWGVWHGLLSALEALGVIPVKRLQKTAAGRALGHVYTLLAVCLGFVLFRSGSLGEAGRMFAAMFGGGNASILSAVTLRTVLDAKTLTMSALCVLLCFPVGRRLAGLEETMPWLRPLSYVLCLCLLALSLCAMASTGFQPFIYAQF